MQVAGARRGAVLVVDDDEINGRLIRRLLVRDFDVDVLCSAEEALERLARGAYYDVILCDFCLGGEMNGEELYATLRSIDPSHAARIVLMTGWDIASPGFLRGFTGRLLAQPFDIGALYDAVEQPRR